MNPNNTFSLSALPRACDFSFIHADKRDNSSAYSRGENIVFSILIDRNFFTNDISIELFDEAISKSVCKASLCWYASIGDKDEYRVSFKASCFDNGLYFAAVKIVIGSRVLIGVKRAGKLEFSENSSSPTLQLSVCDFKYASPEEFYGGIIYHIFVDRFARGGNSEKKPDAVLVKDWSDGVAEYPEYPGAPLKNNTFYGGTLDGVTDKLDHIASLGANIIYLSPIFESASNHKYDTGDYMTVDSMFGGKKALKRLIAECHKRGIRLILDGVFNHTGADSIYFNRYGRYDSVGAYQSASSPYIDWYEFEEHPDKYKSWWGIEILPRLKTDSPAVREYLLGDGGVVDTYAKMGIDGMRLDVADELSDEFIADIKNILSRYSNSSLLYGEVWEDASNKIAYDKRKKYYLGTELDGVMNYPLRTGLIDYAKYGKTDTLFYALDDIIKNAPKRIADAQMNLIGTHDTERVLTVLGGKDPSGLKNSELVSLRMSKTERKDALKKLKALYTVLATLPGIPAIFYGDEAGLEGYSDPFNRMPYPWDNEEEELLSHYRLIGAMRRKADAYKNGGFSLHLLNEDVLVFSRSDRRCKYITVFNNSLRDFILKFSDAVTELADKKKSTDHFLEAGTAKVYKSVKTNKILLKKT